MINRSTASAIESHVPQRLSLMMAMVYSVQGAFWPLLAVHLKDLDIASHHRGMIFATMAIGSFAMPLGFGQLVDRFMAAQKLLALIFLIATGFLVAFAMGVSRDPVVLFFLFLIFWLITAPAYSLTNTIALRHLPRPYEQFPRVRLWGTVGWMAVGWLVSTIMAVTGSVRVGEGAFEAFWIAAVLAILFSAYCLTLPDTPPLVKAGDEKPPGQALKLLRQPGVLLFLATALGVSITTPFVFQVMPNYFEAKGLSRPWISTSLTIGQIPEIATLACLPWLINRIGIKGTLTLGIAAWALRFGWLAFDPPLFWALAGIPLHGIGIACFTVAGQIQMDRLSPRELRGSSQALYTVITSGIGSLSGSLVGGSVIGLFSNDFATVFLVPCVIDSALLICYLIGFKSEPTVIEQTGAAATGRPRTDDVSRGPVIYAGNRMTESADG